MKLELVLNMYSSKNWHCNRKKGFRPTFFHCGTVMATPTFISACTTLKNNVLMLSEFQTQAGRHACKFKHVHAAFVGVIGLSPSHFLDISLFFENEVRVGVKFKRSASLCFISTNHSGLSLSQQILMSAWPLQSRMIWVVSCMCVCRSTNQTGEKNTAGDTERMRT